MVQTGMLPEADFGAGPFAFGKYNVLEEIGRGGMGVVYRALQEDLDRPVALKMILASHLASPDQVRRFHAEAQAAARARHPSVVGVFETGSLQGQHYIAMELIDGVPLHEWMQQRGGDPTEAARLGATIARAVAYLHSLGIVHRDLKPSNILVDRDGVPHVSDFGLAKVFGGVDTGLSASGALLGTPGYMAPEQVSSAAGEPGPWSDVYSLGAILYECCTGEHPFQADTPIAVLMRVLEGEPRPPRSLNKDVPRELETVILKCLEKTPRERYASAEALAEDLDRFLAGEPVEVGSPGMVHRAVRWMRRHPALAARLLAFAVFYAVTVANRLAGIADAAFLAGVSVILPVWAAISLLLHGMRLRDIYRNAVLYAWATVDVGLFTCIVLLGEGARSPMLIIYPLLIAAAGLWSRVNLVWYMTGAVLVSYGILAGHAVRAFPGVELADHHLIFATAMVVLGFVVSYQVRRNRNLNRFITRRMRAR